MYILIYSLLSSEGPADLNCQVGNTPPGDFNYTWYISYSISGKYYN